MNRIILVLLILLFIKSCKSDDPEVFNPEDYIVNADKMPSPEGGMELLRSKIVYPEKALIDSIEGKIDILVFIDENGNVVKTTVLESAHPILDSIALNTIKDVKFTPAKAKEKNVKSQVIVPVHFELE